MNLETIIAQILEATGVFNLKIALFLFGICAVGEFGPSIPYLLETIWLMTGYQVARGVLPAFDLLLLWLVAQAGRQIGSLALYNVGRFGSPRLMRFYHKYLESRLSGKQIVPAGISRRLTNLSSFSVALGRFFGLRIPLALTLGAKGQLSILALGVALASVLWDGIYLFIGATVGATAAVKPVHMILYSLIGLTAFYVVTLLVRLLVKRRPTVAKSQSIR